MIPTRLNQNFTCGYLAGFNNMTGNLIVVHNSPSYTSSLQLDRFKQDLLQYMENNYPGWKCPTINDLESLNRCTFAPFVLKGLKPNYKNSRSVYITTISEICRSVITQQRIYQTVTDTIRIERCRTWDTSGFIVPVIYINGTNCDNLLY